MPGSTARVMRNTEGSVTSSTFDHWSSRISITGAHMTLYGTNGSVIEFDTPATGLVNPASGTDPGVVPARFLIGAARVALLQRRATPEVIAKNFYVELGRR